MFPFSDDPTEDAEDKMSDAFVVVALGALGLVALIGFGLFELLSRIF